jgi:oxygen-independent coproporphyrinogen III oxidase
MIKSENQLHGIYLHIPFCRKACHYCNFHFSTTLDHKADLLRALCREIALTPPITAGSVATVYFGGGTPSLLTAAELTGIVDELYRHFPIDKTAEITLEANPDDITVPLLAAWKAIGINRLSIGIQSFQDKELQWMNRAHDATQASDCIRQVKSAGFDNFSVDLIYGSPLLDDAEWVENLTTAIDMGAPHLSCYALTVEPHTALDAFIRKGQKAPVDPERQARQFTILVDTLTRAGYEQYEISNFALPGYRSRHNSSYWQGLPYYGFGPAAHSFTGNRRRWNIAHNVKYIQSLQNNILPFEEEWLTPVQQINEYSMISLRTSEGLDLAYVATTFGEKYVAGLQKAAGRHIEAGHILVQDTRYVLSITGKFLADGIAADLFFEEEK